MEQHDTTTRNDRDLTPLEAFFADAGMAVTEVEACPVPDCEACHRPLPQAA
ncbi:MAG: hypothetical protein KQH83_07920 [Actinobacteria bacterium]|jgi:hypothetical protein|nr:hypothetical protein [Actinomycetota bacterium]